MKIKTFLTAALLVAVSGSAGANINEAMSRQFGSMQNMTAPAVIVGPEGGVVSGGAFRARFPVRSMTPTRITPPSIRAGCGGIDLQGGSLSFPSAKEFVQVARAVAGNVGGYAFKLALTSMCAQCENIMSEIQELNNLFNKSNLDSCTTAQGIVDSFRSGEDTAAESSLREIGSAWKSYFSSDQYAGTNQGEDRAPAAEMSDQERADAFEGNYVWDALGRAGALIPEMPDTKDSREMLMSLMGTVIFCAGGVGSCPPLKPGEREGEGVADARSRTLTLSQLLDGGTQSVFSCADSACLDMSIQQRDLGRSMVTRMERAFLDPDGILDRLSSPSGGSSALTEEQKQWLGLLGNSAQGVVDLAASGATNRSKAEIFIRDASRTIMAMHYGELSLGVLREVRRQVEVDPRPGKGPTLEALAKAEQQIKDDLSSQREIVSQEVMLLEFRQKLMASMAARIGVINATAAEVPELGG